ncbi:Uncharacterised protein [Candidatus Venteria ishoeyi]|uniref:Uncharacterized protein n=1 Tax=Candidatus Venteria ishoeyi TaxID=1899563 RepID=A0A1H6F4T9_9GAMM|nr:Uncharacterised protein [Candidatus Venteria ishoeyi]
MCLNFVNGGEKHLFDTFPVRFRQEGLEPVFALYLIQTEARKFFHKWVETHNPTLCIQHQHNGGGGIDQAFCKITLGPQGCFQVFALTYINKTCHRTANMIVILYASGIYPGWKITAISAGKPLLSTVLIMTVDSGQDRTLFFRQGIAFKVCGVNQRM